MIDLEGKVLAKTCCVVFAGKDTAVPIMDRCVPHHRDSRFFAFTMAVEGMTRFTRTFGEPISTLFLQDTGNRQRIQLTPPDMVASHVIVLSRSPPKGHSYSPSLVERAIK